MLYFESETELKFYNLEAMCENEATFDGSIYIMTRLQDILRYVRRIE